MKKIIAIALSFALPSIAQQTTPTKPVVPPATKTVKAPPVLTDAQRAAFFKAQAQLAIAASDAEHAQQVQQAKQAAFQAAVAILRKVCGDSADLQMSSDGDPVCIAKSAALTPEVKQ